VINEYGLIENVDDGVSRLNYPLIDGVVSGCPSLLLEPQSTNIVTYSQSLTESIYGTSNAVILDNNVISPDGTLNASSITDSNGGGTNVTQIFLANLSVGTSSQYTYSIFAKKKGLNYISLRVEQFTTPVSSGCFFDLENESIVSVDAGYDSAKIENYGNGWYRCSVTFTTDAVDAIGNLVVRLSKDGISTASVPQDGTSTVYLWGWSCEKQSYPTSYIPTNGAAVTRAAETATGSGDASTFNDSEGVLMAEISALNESQGVTTLSISDNSLSNRVLIVLTSGEIRGQFVSSGNDINRDSSGIIIENFNKIACRYTSNTFKVFVNGYQVGSTATITSPLSGITELSFDRGDGVLDFEGKTKQLQYYNSALTNSELETLTSWTSFTDLANGQLYSIK
jgi:hypothetical protein